MDRRAFIAAVTGGLFAAPLVAEGQQAVKPSRIGYLHANVTASPHLLEAFRQGLRDLGYVEGRNVVIEYRDAKGEFERLPALAAELVVLNVDVIVVVNTRLATAAKRMTQTVPLVVSVGDPVRTGLVTSPRPCDARLGAPLSAGSRPRPSGTRRTERSADHAGVEASP